MYLINRHKSDEFDMSDSKLFVIDLDTMIGEWLLLKDIVSLCNSKLDNRLLNAYIIYKNGVQLIEVVKITCYMNFRYCDIDIFYRDGVVMAIHGDDEYIYYKMSNRVVYHNLDKSKTILSRGISYPFVCKEDKRVKFRLYYTNFSDYSEIYLDENFAVMPRVRDKFKRLMVMC